jgi:hypothetical protein
MAGATMGDVAATYDFLVSQQSIDHVVLGLDFVMFADSDTGRGIRRLTEEFSTEKLRILFGQLLTWDAMRASFATVMMQAEFSDTAGYTDRGVYHDGPYREALASQSHRFLFEREQQQYSYRVFARTDGTAAYREGMRLFRALVSDCRSRGIHLTLFISPIHLEQQLLIRRRGAWSAFMAWKRELIRTVRSSGGAAKMIALWDFATVNPFTTELVPQAPGVAMEWYWDSSHYKTQLGDRVIDRIIKGDDCRLNQCELFGNDLSDIDIDAYLAAQTRSVETVAKRWRANSR